MLLLRGDGDGRLCSASAGTPDRPSNDTLVESGLGGRLTKREVRCGSGGCGKFSMLTVLRNDLADAGSAGDDEISRVRSVGTTGDEAVLDGLGVGRPEGVTMRETVAVVGEAVAERRRIAGDGRPEASRRGPGVSGASGPGTFRVLLIGSGGSGIVGGAAGGRRGRWYDWDVIVAVGDIAGQDAFARRSTPHKANSVAPLGPFQCVKRCSIAYIDVAHRASYSKRSKVVNPSGLPLYMYWTTKQLHSSC